jgi:Ca2+-binding RTX toxin-like protein
MKMVMNHFSLDIRFVSVVTVVVVALAIFYSLTNQITWAALINCPIGTILCNGTTGNDIIIGTTPGATIHGLAGNDYIIGYEGGENQIIGDDGDDTMIGGEKTDIMFGGRGNDKYDGYFGNDYIWEVDKFNIPSGDDVISGGYGDDLIYSGGGADKIHGGPEDDSINPNISYFQFRDFSSDFVDCGTGYDEVYFNSAEDTASSNCDSPTDLDG